MVDSILSNEMMSPEDLSLDPQNPRFPNKSLNSEAAIIKYLHVNADVDELIQSILSAGYKDFEPFVVLEGENIVLEGNRRLAAIRLIGDEALRTQLEIDLPEIEEPAGPPQLVRVLK